MEKSLDKLIEHLLGEIALCGPGGATVSELTNFIDDFYYDRRQNGLSSHSISQVVDDAFVASVWRWLGRHPDIYIGKDKEHNNTPLRSLIQPNTPLIDQHATLPRISVSKDRIYQAICGHEPDDKRVFKSEYGLLIVIAAARSDGILQGELGRVAGQDKRSVPKRTDALHAKGYIIKETVILRGFKSSRLTLRRFATQEQINKAGSGLSEAPPAVRRERTLRDLLNDVATVFGNAALIESEDLAKRVRMTSQLAQKALVKVLRTLARAGYVKKVKAAVGESAHTGEPKVCFQRLRDFALTDLDLFMDAPFTLDRGLGEIFADLESSSADGASGTSNSDHAAIQWNPDRNVANTFQHAAALAGATGITIASAREAITGLSIKRPVESRLDRLSFASLSAQPQHLRHLALVRSGKSAAGGVQYTHHSLPAFLNELEQGKIDAGQVRGTNALGRGDNTTTTQNISAEPATLDAFGFPIVRDRKLVRDGPKSLTECLRSVPIEDAGNHHDESSDEAPRTGEHTGAQPRAPDTRAVQAAGLPLVSNDVSLAGSPDLIPKRRKYTRKKVDDPDDGVIRGRPRKFLAGTEKFWQYHFWQARLEAEGPQAKKAGTMSHPAGKTIFRNRPKNFDETLVRAREAGLTLPKLAADISEEWVQKTQTVLERQDPGGYVTPSGMHLFTGLRTSQILIVRSNKLQTLDFRECPKVYAYRFMTSMVAHSSQNWRWYPTKPPRHKRAKPLPPPKLDVEHPDELLEAFGKIPRLGVFYSNGEREDDSNSHQQLETLPQVTSEEYRELMAETDVDSEVERREQEEKAKNKSKPPPVPQHDTRGGKAASPTQPYRRSTSSRPAADVAHRQGIPVTTPTADPVNSRRSSFQFKFNHEGISEPFDQSPLQSRPSRQRKLTRKATAWLASEGHAGSVGSPPAISASAVESADEDAPGEKDDRPDAGGSLSEHLVFPSTAASLPPGSSASVFAVSSSSDPARATDATFASPMENSGTPAKSTPSRRPIKRRLSDRFDVSERLPKIRRLDPTSAGTLCRHVILSLFQRSGGVAVQNPSLIRQCCSSLWKEAGGDDLPDLLLIRHTLDSLVNEGQLKRHTFTFRGKGGIMLSRIILFPAAIDPSDLIIQDLKQAIIDADPMEYVPSEWQKHSSLSRDQNVPTLQAESGEGLAQGHPRKAEPLRSPPKKRQRQTRRRSSVTSRSRSGTPSSVPPSPATGFLTLKAGRSSSITSESSVASSADEPSYVGFLTLKVPRLSTLTQVQQFNATLRKPDYLETAPTIAQVPEAPKAIKQRKPRASRSKKNSNLQQIIWKKPTLPESLEAILEEEYAQGSVSRPSESEDETMQFSSLVDTVQAWEERLTEKLTDIKVPWNFINHTAASFHVPSSEAASWYLVEFDLEGRSLEKEAGEPQSWLPFSQVLEKLRLEPGLGSRAVSTSNKRRVTRQDTGSIRKKRRFNFEDVDFGDAGRKRRQRQDDTDYDAVEIATEPQQDRRPSSRKKKGNPPESQHAAMLSKTSNEDLFRIAVSVVVVRTLIGGPDKTINWTIVNRLHPGLQRSALISRWKAIEFSYMTELESMTTALRSEYLEAVQTFEVALVTAANQAESPWDDIFGWALSTLPRFVEEAVLPSSRAMLLTNYNLRYPSQENIRPLLAPHAAHRAFEREEIIASVPFSAPLIQPLSTDKLKVLARPLILATLLTSPFTTRVASLASQRLVALTFDRNAAEQAVAEALVELQSHKILVKNDTAMKRTPALVENGKCAYKLTEKMTEVLEVNRTIHWMTLKEAADYKLSVLDEAFAHGEVVEIPNQGSMTNGQMLAVINLINSEMLTMRPGYGGIKSRYGIAWERVGYQTRQLEAKELGFEVVLEPTDAYPFGDVAEETRGEAPKRCNDASWPLWVDVLDNFLVEVWEKVLAAVVGMTHIRPGIQAGEIKETLGELLTEHEICSVLEWAEAKHFVAKTGGGNGWEALRWWWMCLGRLADWKLDDDGSFPATQDA
ncbi:uncharacterized protein HMPREF1541_03630 [Cyphellophora europaea CBS 101466]|uniref:Uncharacterized protein n=1 Tax=Cyphellophora europaea (strain CBS 101466) TaxID=1220924 RepID=W2S145_CYPE1|nr:uncharacterized protein HMPREF1541_03630 [Cyphellophora europaea CBS 101466]ETN41694.1 hypothetical protein HMPREF1541_03630 [Cyphellophora europaea CBS 101466]